MNIIENEQVNVPTRSDLSDWVGAPVLLRDTPNESGRVGEDKVVADYLDYTKRMYDVLRDTRGLAPTGDFVPLGPSNPKTKICCLLDLNKLSKPLAQANILYEGFAYDSIDITVSLSDTKGIAGAVAVGCYPYAAWSDTPFTSEVGYHTLNEMTLQNLVNTSPECQMITFSEAQDAKFNIPWQYQFPYLPREFLNYDLTDGQVQVPIGAPIFFFHVMSAHFVSSITGPARLRVFATFNNLRYFGPGVQVAAAEARNVPLQVQSGLEAAAAMGTALAVDALVETGVEIVSSIFASGDDGGVDETYKAGTYEAPTAVQMSYAGDTTAVGAPPTSPIFAKNLETTQTHPLSIYFQRPQLIYSQKVNDTEAAFYANPTFPTGWRDGPNQLCNYFRWFTQGAQYWKGTIVFHAVILGHPMVEVGYKMHISYPPKSVNIETDVGTASMLNGVCNGVTHIAIPMPTLNVMDHFPILDNLNTNLITSVQESSGSQLHATFSIVSTMLDTLPELDVLWFMTGGDDFALMQFNPVGLAQVDNVPISARSVPLQAQIGLTEVDVTFETRARVQESTHTLMTISCVEDYFKVWSRALPYDTYEVSTEEPDPKLKIGAYPRWFPMQDSGAARTLDVNNSWWVTNDFLSFYSSQFMMYRGSIAWKILCVDNEGREYAYVSLGIPAAYMRQTAHSPYTYYDVQLPAEANLGYGCVVTPRDKQPVMDLTIPYRAGFAWNLTNPMQLWTNIIGASVPNQAFDNNVHHNIVLHQPEGDLRDALFRKAGADFNLTVETMLPPPTLWLAKGFNWKA